MPHLRPPDFSRGGRETAPRDARSDPHSGDGTAEGGKAAEEWEASAWEQTTEPQRSPRINGAAHSGEFCSEPYSVAEEREVLASLLERCTKELESELRTRLRQQRIAVDEAIAHTLESFRKQSLHLVSVHQKVCPDEAVVREEFAAGAPVDKRTARTPAPLAACGSTHELAPATDSNNSIMQYLTRLTRLAQQSCRSTSVRSVRSEGMPISRESGSRRGRLTARFGSSFRILYPTSFIHGTFFNLISAALILSNAAFIGYQMHVGIEHEFGVINGDAGADLDWRNAELSFLAFFTAELLLRIGTDRLAFLRGVEWRWNLFDTIIVGVSLIETVAASILSGVGLNFPFLRLVRVVRVLRVLKVLHMIPFFKRLGLMMTSVAASLSALAPAFVLLILVIYMFGICLMQGVVTHLESNPVKDKEAWLSTLEFRFGSISDTMQTLFMSITGGLSWVEVVDCLIRMDGVYHVVYMFYVGFVQICVLNIVTGVFVDTVHQMYQPERSEMIEKEAAKRKSILQKLTSLLEEADSDGSGSITWEEFHEFTQDPHMQMYLSAHEIDITQAREIFNLIDHTGQGEVQIDEFVISLLEFRGAAKGSDVLILRNDVNKILAKLSPFIRETSKATRELKMMLVDAQLGIPPEAVDTEQTVRPSVDTSKNSRSSWFWRSRVGKGELTPPGP